MKHDCKSMIYTSFTPAAAARPSLIGTALCRGSYPVDCRTPEQLEKILEKLARRR